MSSNLSGHAWTVGALLHRTLFPTGAPKSERWSATLDDPISGQVVLSGRLTRPPGARELVVLVHGLGGSSESGYLMSTALCAEALGLASLRLNLRGADGESGDFYHGGLTDDLHAVVSSLRDFERVFVLGFSLGGHVALRFATEVKDPRVAAIAAVCSPLDLAAGADAMDRRLMTPYRSYVLRRLRANYERTARFGKVPTPSNGLRRVRTLRQWDSLTVVPRFGFDNADDYYSKASVGPLLDRLHRPTLLVAAEGDPMVPPSAIRPALDTLDNSSSVARFLKVRWLERGGHLGFPKQLDLGQPGARGLESQALQWLLHA